MGLSSALATALAGLRTNQAALSIISSNVANAQTPGYVEQSPNQVELGSGGDGSTVQMTGVNRTLDRFIQNQLRTEISGSGYTNQIANILGQLQSVYGTPGGNGTLETALSNFTTALQSLSTNPGNQSSQNVALSAAQSLAAQLNSTTQGIQTLRTNVDQDLGTLASQANTDLTQIDNINTKLQGLSPTDPQAATLMDQRDSAINDISKMTDVRVVTDSSNQVSLFTTSGIQLVGGGIASSINYKTQGTLDANALYNVNPTKSGVGSLSIQLPNGSQIDAVANNVFSSGQIAADLKLRDQTLVQAQTQVDQLAASMSSALSDVTTAGTAVAGPPSGFSVDTSNVLPGNTINLSYTDSSNVQHNVQIVNVTDPSALPLQNAPGANPQQVGINFSLGMASAVAQLSTAFAGTGVFFSNSGSTLSVVGSAAATVKSASTTTTTQTLAAGSRGRRQHAVELHVCAAHHRNLQLFGDHRARLGGPAAQEHDLELPAAVHRCAGQCLDHGDPVAAGPERRGLDAAAEIQLHCRRQHRHRNVEPNPGAEHLCSQCSHHVGGAKHDAGVAAGQSVEVRETCR